MFKLLILNKGLVFLKWEIVFLFVLKNGELVVKILFKLNFWGWNVSIMWLLKVAVWYFNKFNLNILFVFVWKENSVILVFNLGLFVVLVKVWFLKLLDISLIVKWFFFVNEEIMFNLVK